VTLGAMLGWLGPAACLALAACAQPARDAEQPAPDVIHLPTPPAAVEGILDMTGVGPDDVVYDLGSGDGRIVIAAARRGATATGVEIDPELIDLSRRKARAAGVENRTRFVRADLFRFDFSDASVVTLYLSERLNERLRPRLLDELRPGTRVASYIFAMGDWQPDRVERFADNRVSLWIVPADAAGTWEWREDVGAGPARRLVLAQRYQEVKGTIASAGESVIIQDPRLLGDRLSFAVPASASFAEAPLRFEGRIDGDTLRGTVRGPGQDRAWTATRIARPN